MITTIRRQAIASSNADLLPAKSLGTNFSEVLIKRQKLFFQENAPENTIIFPIIKICSSDTWGLFL